MDHKYEKGGDAGSKGVRFQVDLLTLFLLKAMLGMKEWRLSTENNKAGKFDDVVLECPDGDVLLQAKHRENKNKITLEDLLSTNTKRDDFSLPKYFISYQEIKCRFKIETVIVCTNTNFDEKISTFLISRTASPDSVLYHEASNCLLYTFNDNILPDLMRNTKIYLQQSRNKNIDEAAINDDNLKDFLQHLQFYFNYPSGQGMENIIERQLSVMRDICNFYNETSSTDLHSKMMDWFQQKDGKCLTDIHGNAMFLEIKRDKYWQKLEQYNVFFQYNNPMFDNSTTIFSIVNHKGLLLREIQIYRAIQDIKNVLCVHPESDVKELKEILRTFELPKYTFVIIIWSKVMEKSLVQEVTSKLEQILRNKNYKKVIFVTGNSNELTTQLQLRKLNHEVIHRSVAFDDLLDATKNNLLRKRIINFQGNTSTLEELFALKTTDDYGAALSSEILEKLVKNEEVTVGREVHHLNFDIGHLYINRTFIRDKKKIEEGNIFELGEKVILIDDGAGMGKSTVLTNLAIAIKKKYPHLWVIKIVLSDYTRILDASLSQNKRTLNMSELLDSQIETRLKHQLEKYLFSADNRVVLMLDGVDEVSPNYTELVTNMIVDSQRAGNFAKIVVTSRPHVTAQLEDKLEVKSFKLQPFTKQNQVDYLASYWTRNLGIDYTDKEKCERYAATLLSQMKFSNSRRYYRGQNHFASIPLQVRMLAEIFQECTPSEHSDWKGCKEYLEAKEMVSNMPKINFAKLFKMFVDKKRSVYLQRLNPFRNAMTDLSLNKRFDECLEYHRAQALEVILDKRKCELFVNCKKNNNSVESEVFNIGIIQKTDNGIHFIHRTFAEYFVAECLVKELQYQNQNVKFQGFLINEILHTQEYYHQYGVVCNFFDSFLQDIWDFLPSNPFKEYECSTFKISEYPMYLMHDLAENGYVGILQLIFKSVDFRAVRPNNFKEYTPLHTKNTHKLRCRNALTVLRYFISQGGVNIRDKFDNTPLDLAIDKGHLDMVKILVEQGANINCDKPRSHYRYTNIPLYSAVINGYIDIVKFLIDHGANIIPNGESGYEILYEAVSENHADITEYLLEKILEKDYGRATKDPFVLFAAAYLGRLDILEPLLRDGAAVNDRISNGETLLFGAARGGQLDMVKYLIDHGANVNSTDEKGYTALHFVSKMSSLNSTAKLLIDLGININVTDKVNDETALQIAVQKRNLGVVQLLIEHGADMTSITLQRATFTGDLNIVKLLIQNGANIDQKDDFFSALKTAVYKGRNDILKYLLEVRNNRGINFKEHSGKKALSAANENGKPNVYYNEEQAPLLHSAVKWNRVDTIRVLMEYGINLNVTNICGNTALHVAVEKIDILTGKNMVKFLVDSGVEVNVRNKNGHTALHALLTTSKIDCLRLVKELDIEAYDERWKTMSEDDMVKRWRANCYEKNYSGERSLQIEEKYLSVVIYLIKCGTDIHLEDSQGNTVASLIFLNQPKRFIKSFLAVNKRSSFKIARIKK